jgi:hypothetical protein
MSIDLVYKEKKCLVESGKVTMKSQIELARAKLGVGSSQLIIWLEPGFCPVIV